MILYAGWDRYWSVNFDGGANRADINYNLPDSQSVRNGETAATPWEAGTTLGTCVFTGWTTDYEGLHPYDFTAPVTANLTLYGQWHNTRCKLTIHANGHGFDRLIYVTEGEALPQPDDPSDVYYQHFGWYTNAECLQPYSFSQPVTGDLDLYNKWAANPMMLCVLNDTDGIVRRYHRRCSPVPSWLCPP